MFTPSFAAGDDRVWIVLVELFMAFVLSVCLYWLLRVVLLTPIRIKLNRYPRFLRSGTTTLTFCVFVLLFASFFTTALNEVRAKEAYQAEQREKLYQMLRPTVERVDKIFNAYIQAVSKNSKSCPVQIDRNEE